MRYKFQECKRKAGYFYPVVSLYYLIVVYLIVNYTPCGLSPDSFVVRYLFPSPHPSPTRGEGACPTCSYNYKLFYNNFPLKKPTQCLRALFNFYFNFVVPLRGGACSFYTILSFLPCSRPNVYVRSTVALFDDGEEFEFSRH